VTWLGKQCHDVAGLPERGLFRIRDQMRHARPAAVHLWPPEPTHVDPLASDAADDIRPGYEDASAIRHDHQISQGSSVGGAAGRRAKYERQLKHLAGGPHHGREHAADAIHGHDALGQFGAAGMPDSDYWTTFATGCLDRCRDERTLRPADRSATDSGVRAEDDDLRALDPSAGNDYS
jgi:hypothetical protein